MVPQSRLVLFCEKFIEGGWLAALITAPLFFNIYSSRVFEPDKITLLRSVALAMVVAWLILRAERLRAGSVNKAGLSLSARLWSWARRLSDDNPLTLPALLLIGAFTISTLASVSPTVSFFGSYQRLQGFYTTLAYLVIFFMAASLIRTRQQIDRAISVTLLAGFVVAFYGIIQHSFLDPLPWVGDVTTRVASNLGNSIFIGAYLILTIPLAIARLIDHSDHSASQFASPRDRLLFYAGVMGSILVFTAAWGLSFDLGARQLIESSYTGVLTPVQLSAAQGSFDVALVITVVVLLGWLVAAIFLKKRIAGFVLSGIYALILSIVVVAVLFSQSRGPLLGLLGGLFTFGVLVALVRGARKLALGAVGAAGALLVFLAFLNIPNSPLEPLREMPYVGRLGRVFELEGGTGRVRVLIWQGALKLVTPHVPLWSPITGDDPLNVIRPLIGYGPETMYVAYNQFYPPELGQLESRSATPDRSHNETFDALVTTGLFGFVAENLVFLTLFYFALKWLGFISSARERNVFVALWYGAGIVLTILFGAVMGWHFLGVALPAGMILGFFIYLVGIALLRGNTLAPNLGTRRALWLIALVAVFVAHFIEIHFGIAIVSTRTYFWFLAAVFVALGTGRVADLAPLVQEAYSPELSVPVEIAPVPTEGGNKSRRKRTRSPVSTTAGKKTTPLAFRQERSREISTAPLITFAFLVGLVLAVMGFDYINTNNLRGAQGTTFSALDIVTSALTLKNTTAGMQPSFAMLWLFIGTLFVGTGIGIAEWGRAARLALKDWLTAIGLVVILALAIFSSLVFYHVLLIATTGPNLIDAIGAAVQLFTLFVLVIMTIVAITLLFDHALPPAWVSRPTNWVVVPVLILMAAVLILSTNVDPIRADIIYKQALALGGENATTAISLYRRALDLQPFQDYYLLFMGRGYLDAAKFATDPTQQQTYLQDAEQVLTRARELNPLNTDHSANLARLMQARAVLTPDVTEKIKALKQSAEYFEQATRLSPNTVHLYNQYAQALLDYQAALREQKETGAADEVRAEIRATLDRALEIDSTFCFTYAVRAQSAEDWQTKTTNALDALRLAPRCGDVFEGEGRSIAAQALAAAGDQAVAAGSGAQYEALLKEAATATPSIELFTTLANYYSKAGEIPQAVQAVDDALKYIPENDAPTRKRYEDFRFTLGELQKLDEAVAASPNDPEAHRALAKLWLARGQNAFALSEFQQVLRLKPGDYEAQRNVTLLLIANDRLPEAEATISTALQLAPATDRAFWDQLQVVVNGVQNGQSDSALAALDQMTKTLDQNDRAAVSALRALAEKIKGAG